MIKKSNITLKEIAFQVMTDKGFLPEFPSEVIEQVNALTGTGSPPEHARDVTQLCWISIDNDDSLDLDQLTYCESTTQGADRIYIAVADVNGLVEKDSPVDLYAGHNTTSVYTPSAIFPMLPPRLSTDLTSLNEGEIRSAIVIEVNVAVDGKFEMNDVYQAIVKNKAKLAYNAVSAWLDGKAPEPAKKEVSEDVKEQLKRQDAIASRIKEYRDSLGALSFKTTEVVPVISDGIPVKLEELEVNRGRLLIENFMISANVAMTTYMSSQNIPVIRRIVRTPKRWARIVELAREYGVELPEEPDGKALQDFLAASRKADPERFPDLSLAIIKLIGRGEYIVSLPGEPSIGHFDLALTIYSHTTAPNRRYPDLIMQRLLKSHFNGVDSPYTGGDLKTLTEYCTTKENDASKVERRVLKSAAAMVLQDQIGRSFRGLITGINENGTWVRLLKPPVEGKLAQGGGTVDVGDHVNVKLIHVDVPNGFIDFALIK